MPTKKVTKRITVKKTTAVKATGKKSKTLESAVPVEFPIQSTPVQTTVHPNGSVFNVLRKPSVIILIILVILGGVFYFLRKWLVVAEVNGQPISRMDYTHQLEIQDGDQVMNEIIAKTLVLQDADKHHVVMSQSEIDSRIKAFQATLSKQGQTLDQYLLSKKMTKQDFTDDVRVQIILEKLLSKDITVTDKEVDEYITQNKDSIPATVKPEDLKAQVKQRLQQQKLQEKLPTFIQGLQKQATVKRFGN